MAEDTHVSKTLEDMRRQVVAKLEEARTALGAMNAVEAMFGIQPTTFADLGMSGVAATGAAPLLSGAGAAPRRSGPIRPDEFLGQEPMEAAKNYLRRVNQAVEIDEIADAVERGGAVIHGSGWRERLETSLMRASKGVIKIGERTYGLEEFYSPEQIRRIRVSRRASRLGSGKKKRAKGKAKVISKPPKAAATGPARAHKPTDGAKKATSADPEVESL